ncbi:MAG: DUF1801 domain-containing protein [Bryobacteraceae bacterium]
MPLTLGTRLGPSEIAGPMANTDYKSVDHYIASQPEANRPILERVRATILKALPGAQEGISYQIPVYKVDGRMVLYFAGWKDHYSIYPLMGLEEIEAELAPYKHSKGTARFSLSQPVPVRLIARIAKLRARASAVRSVKKAK